MADTHCLLDWRNDATTRLNSQNSAEIGLTEHETWLARVLASPGHVLRIAQVGAEPVGVVRADRVAHGWELSWTVAPHARGRGHGGSMLRFFVASLDGRLTAVIRKDNTASIRMAAAAGLKLGGEADRPGFQLWIRK